MKTKRESDAEEICELRVAVRNVRFLVRQRANHVPQRAQRAVDEAGFLEGLAARPCERLPLTARQVDEVELRLPRDGDVRLDFLRFRPPHHGHFAGQVEREDRVGARGAHVHVGHAHAAVEQTLLDEVVRFRRRIHVQNRQVLHRHAVVLRQRFSDQWS